MYDRFKIIVNDQTNKELLFKFMESYNRLRDEGKLDNPPSVIHRG